MLLNRSVRVLRVLRDRDGRRDRRSGFGQMSVGTHGDGSRVVVIRVRGAHRLCCLRHVLCKITGTVARRVRLNDVCSSIGGMCSVDVLCFSVNRNGSCLCRNRGTFMNMRAKSFLRIAAGRGKTVIHGLPTRVFPRCFLVHIGRFGGMTIAPLRR